MTGAFLAIGSDVVWVTPGGPLSLSPESVEDLLTVFDREGCAKAFNDLHQANIAAGGIPRCSSMRAV